MKREIQINLDLYKMQSYGLTFYDIQSAVQGENVNISGGDLAVDGVRRSLRVTGEFKAVDQIANLVVGSSTGARVRLKDVAEVVDVEVGTVGNLRGGRRRRRCLGSGVGHEKFSR